MFTRIFTAAVMVGLAWSQMAWAQDNKPGKAEGAIQNSEDSFRRTTERMPEPTTRPVNTVAADDQGIREALGDVTQAALTQGGFNTLVERLAAADRSRLDRSKQIINNHPILDERIAQFRKNWQARYNQEFKLRDKDAVYGAAFASIKQGYAPEGARLASEKILPNDVAPAAPHDDIRDRAQKIATVTLASSSSAPVIDVQMVREPAGWKIDVPDAYSAQEMHDALLAQITDMNEHRDQWPADVNEAYRAVSRRVLMAVLEIESPRSADTNKSVPRDPAQLPTEDRILNPNAVQ